VSTNVRQALHNAITSASSITSLLTDGANGVYLAGRVSPSTPTPCIGIRHVGRSGGPRRLPFFIDTYFIYVYDDAPAAQAISVVNIDNIIGALRQEVHGASLTVDANEERVFQCYMENLDSPDMWDELLEKTYKFVRVRIEGVYLYDYRS
jgi:hypothetical protein